MAKPKLCLIPSGVADDKVFSVLPSNGDGDFDFDRGSTATRINAQGLIETVSNDLPRLNYPLLDGKVVGCPSLLLEDESRNQIINSEDLSNVSWSKTNAVIDSNSTISPDGTLNADKITFNTSGNFARIVSPTLTFINSTSFFIKYIDLEYILIFVGTSSNGVYVNIKEGYSTSTVIGAGLDITFKKYPNDWLRIEASGANNGTGLEIYAANSTPNYNPITLNGSFYLWGLQAETNSYNTSYIPTTTTATTRLAETCNGAGTSDTFNDSEGVLMVEMSALANDGNYKFISISDGTTSNRVSVYFDNLNKLSASVPDVGAFSSNVNIKHNNKVAFKYKSGGYSFYVNGFELGTSTSTAGLHSGLNTLNFDFGGGSDDFYGNTKQIQYFDTTLTDSELETLTSWVSFQEMAEAQLYTIQ